MSNVIEMMVLKLHMDKVLYNSFRWHDSWKTHFTFPCRCGIHRGMWSCNRTTAATLALGLWPRQGFARLQVKKEAGSHTTYSWECEKVWRNEPSHPKGVPLWGVGVPMDSWIFRGRFQGSKLNGLRNSLYQWKALGTYISKMGSHCPFGHLKHNLWPKKGRESNWQFDSRPLKVRNWPNFHA
jgi:hypothetical protein